MQVLKKIFLVSAKLIQSRQFQHFAVVGRYYDRWKIYGVFFSSFQLKYLVVYLISPAKGLNPTTYHVDSINHSPTVRDGKIRLKMGARGCKNNNTLPPHTNSTYKGFGNKHEKLLFVEQTVFPCSTVFESVAFQFFKIYVNDIDVKTFI